MNHFYPVFMTSPIGLLGGTVNNNQLVGFACIYNINTNSKSKSSSYIDANLQSFEQDLKNSFKDSLLLQKFGISLNLVKIIQEKRVIAHFLLILTVVMKACRQIASKLFPCNFPADAFILPTRIQISSVSKNAVYSCGRATVGYCA